MNGTLLKSQARGETALSDDEVTVAGQRGVFVTLDVTEVPLGKEASEEAVAAAEAAVTKATEEVNAEALAEAEAALATAEAELAVAEEAEEGTLTLSIEGRDPASGEHVTLTAFAATKKASELGDGVILAFTLYPGAAETTALGGHEVMALGLPRGWRVRVTHSKPGEWTYSVGASPLQ